MDGLNTGSAGHGEERTSKKWLSQSKSLCKTLVALLVACLATAIAGRKLSPYRRRRRASLPGLGRRKRSTSIRPRARSTLCRQAMGLQQAYSFANFAPPGGERGSSQTIAPRADPPRRESRSKRSTTTPWSCRSTARRKSASSRKARKALCCSLPTRSKPARRGRTIPAWSISGRAHTSPARSSSATTRRSTSPAGRSSRGP